MVFGDSTKKHPDPGWLEVLIAKIQTMAVVGFSTT